MAIDCGESASFSTLFVVVLFRLVADVVVSSFRLLFEWDVNDLLNDVFVNNDDFCFV